MLTALTLSEFGDDTSRAAVQNYLNRRLLFGPILGTDFYFLSLGWQVWNLIDDTEL